MRATTRCTATLVALLLVAGCARDVRLATEDTGRRAITWRNDIGSAPPTPDTNAQASTERTLLTQLHDSEQKSGDDLATADILYNLAILRKQQGQLAEAEQLYQRALAIHEQRQGSNHPDVAMVLNNMAALQVAQAHYDAAQPLLERALSIRQTSLGPEDLLTAQSMNNLALLYAAQGDAGRAEPLYRRALAILDSAKQPRHSELRKNELERVLDNYAALLYDTGRDAEAMKLEARARAVHAAGETLPDPTR